MPQGFGDDPILMIIGKVLAIFVFLVVMTLFAIVFERKVIGRMQTRPGPNRTGPAGALQSLADGLKLGVKEEIIPVTADKAVYFLAPLLSAIPAFLSFAVVPFGPEVSIFGIQTHLQLTDFEVGVLYMLACSSLGVYGIVLAGWASGSTYPLLGGLRSAAQMVSYEIGMGLSIVAVFLTAGSLSPSEIVAGQSDTWNGVPIWYGLVLLPSFIIYAISVVGETNRAPFDLPEGESEIVGGFHTEYSSMKFAMFFLAEYINMVTVSGLAATLFLGGWQAPWPVNLWDGANSGWWPVLWFTLKVLLALFVFVWLRGALPRMRYDQFMALGWKVLVPASLVWILLVAGVRTLKREEMLTGTTGWLIGGGVMLALVLVAMFWPDRKPDGPDAGSGSVELVGASPTATGAGSRFPIPPMDLVVPPSPRLREAELVGPGDGEE